MDLIEKKTVQTGKGKVQSANVKSVVCSALSDMVATMYIVFKGMQSSSNRVWCQKQNLTVPQLSRNACL